MSEVTCERCNAPLDMPIISNHRRYGFVCNICEFRLNPPAMLMGLIRGTDWLYNISLRRTEVHNIAFFEKCGWFLKIKTQIFNPESSYKELYLMEFRGTVQCNLVPSKRSIPRQFNSCMNSACILWS